MSNLSKNTKIKFFDQLRNAMYFGEIITVGNSCKVIVAETFDDKAYFKTQQFTYEYFSDLIQQKSVIPA
jgi:acid stress-induced BolA-like protein IbaG/YrbA